MYNKQQLIDIDRRVKIALTALTHRQTERARALLSNLDIDLSEMIESAEESEPIGHSFPTRLTAFAEAGAGPPAR